MNEYEIFDEVKALYNTSDEAWRVYNELKQRSLIQKSNGIILYVCSSKRFAHICFDNLYESLCERFKYIDIPYFSDIKEVKLTCDKERRIIKVTAGEEINTYKVVTIKEIANELDGWRVKDVKFYE